MIRAAPLNGKEPIVFASTWIGYGVWNWLIARYPVGMVVPFTLLVPIVAILSSVLVLDEPFQLWKMTAGLLVIGGLCINILGSRFLVKERAVIKPEFVWKFIAKK